MLTGRCTYVKHLIASLFLAYLNIAVRSFVVAAPLYGGSNLGRLVRRRRHVTILGGRGPHIHEEEEEEEGETKIPYLQPSVTSVVTHSLSSYIRTSLNGLLYVVALSSLSSPEKKSRVVSGSSLSSALLLSALPSSFWVLADDTFPDFFFLKKMEQNKKCRFFTCP